MHLNTNSTGKTGADIKRILGHFQKRLTGLFLQFSNKKTLVLIPKVSSTMEFDVEFNLERISGRI
ncbi:hypothetical protein FACS1894111_03730 [Clostridia bacterium]|nr:hypothetical protein FACS1894111_03730 [Clostridia bacterium]